jgi:hypothetical protein
MAALQRQQTTNKVTTPTAIKIFFIWTSSTDKMLKVNG